LPEGCEFFSRLAARAKLLIDRQSAEGNHREYDPGKGHFHFVIQLDFHACTPDKQGMK
jgi:hypothetical protein